MTTNETNSSNYHSIAGDLHSSVVNHAISGEELHSAQQEQRQTRVEHTLQSLHVGEIVFTPGQLERLEEIANRMPSVKKETNVDLSLAPDHHNLQKGVNRPTSPHHR